MSNTPNMPLALITGAGSGIGEAVCYRLDKLGYRLVLSGSTRGKLDTLAAKLQYPAIIEVADLSKRDDVDRLCNSLRQYEAGLEIVFVNAGMVGIGHFAERDAQQIDRELDINLRSALLIISACLPKMQQQKKGHIIATCSIGGIMSLRGNSIYSASKFALRGFLASLQQELINDNIKVSGLYPGAIDTPMLRHEACNGGSPLNFLQEAKSVDDVADAFIRTLKTGRLETYIPYSDSITARLLSVFPWITPKIIGYFEKAGEKGRIKFLAARNLKKN